MILKGYHGLSGPSSQARIIAINLDTGDIKLLAKAGKKVNGR